MRSSQRTGTLALVRLASNGANTVNEIFGPIELFFAGFGCQAYVGLEAMTQGRSRWITAREMTALLSAGELFRLWDENGRSRQSAKAKISERYVCAFEGIDKRMCFDVSISCGGEKFLCIRTCQICY